MKRFFSARILSGLFMLAALVSCVTAHAAEDSRYGYPVITYDSQKDLISLKANQLDLGKVLTAIAFETGVDIRMDPALKKNISADIKNKSVETALAQLARGTSHVFYYQENTNKKNKNKKKLLTGMKVLPAGKQDGNAARSLITNLGNTALTRSSGNKNGVSQKRRQARYETMTPQQRAEHEEALGQLERDNRTKKAYHEKRRAETETNRRVRAMQRQKKLERMKKENPEQYERLMQRRQAARQELQESLKQERNVGQ